MNLFEFLMILLSLIVGLGLAEILSGVAGALKSDTVRGFSFIHSGIVLTVFMGLLQVFWESWGLRSVEEWSFPGMLLMLGSPILLFLIAHIIFPDRDSTTTLEEYYFKQASLVWFLAGLTVVVGTLFRPVAFGTPILALDNISSLPTLAVCIILSTVKARIIHLILVPLTVLFVLLDTLAISYSIG